MRVLARRLARVLPVGLVRWYVRYSPFPQGKATIMLSASPRARLRPKVVPTHEGPRLLVVTTGDIVQEYLYWFGVWEPDLSALFKDTLSKGDVCIDVGANIGYFSMLAAEEVGPTGTVFAFEPGPTAFHILRVNAAINEARHVLCSRDAVGDHQGTIELVEPTDGQLAQLGNITEGTHFIAPLVTLDLAVPRDQWTACRLLKIDVDGGELAVLEGARALLASAPRIIVCCEVGPETATQVFALMSALGFDAQQIPNDYDARTHARRKRRALIPLKGHPGYQIDVAFIRNDLPSPVGHD